MKFAGHAIISVLALLLTAPLHATTVQKVEGTVRFAAKGNPGFLRIDGEGGKVQGSVTEDAGNTTGELTVELKDFKTGISLRDEHMRDKYLEVAKFPLATLKLKSVTGETWTGDLTLKGVTKPVSGKVSADKIATFKVNLEEYPIGVPSYLGVTVAKEVEVVVNLKATP